MEDEPLTRDSPMLVLLIISIQGVSMSNPRNYVVGWICAISTEYIAAQAFLNEEHDGPQQVSPGDNNDYTLGKIGKHNVVLAVLPDSEYGIASAAAVARDMFHSFPNIRIGLLVGIGGGAPSERHVIRLGDVVVSTPCGKECGVIQYDFGKAVQNNSFQYTKLLDQPPTALRTAINGIKAQYERKGHQLEEEIETALSNNPRLRKKYGRPDPNTDTLFKADVVHDSSCTTLCSDNPRSLVWRPIRDEDQDNPVIHYGLIASGNQLVKDAYIRDKFIAEKDILCFDMEAAGLMNHFPCLVIRGICDYSDSHKNEKWQGYAAMAAAAFAKDLLHRIPPNRIEAEKTVIESISDAVGSIASTVLHVAQMKSGLDDAEHFKVLNWLTPIDYGPQQSDYFQKRQPGTGKWLLDSPEYLDWRQTPKKTLFCPGVPGAGKTLLTSVIVDDLYKTFDHDQSVGILYIYCDFRRTKEQQIDDLLMSLVKQLSQSGPLASSVRTLYDKHNRKRTRPSLDEISKVLQSVATIYSRIFLVIDALDECRGDRCRVRLCEDLLELQRHHGANILITSRPIPKVVQLFKITWTLEIRAKVVDLRRYLDNHMQRLPSCVQESPQLQEQIKAVISEAVDGMFLLAHIYLSFLDDKITPNAVHTALEAFQQHGRASEGDQKAEILMKAYMQAMERIKGQKQGFRELAMNALLWIACARRSLSTTELQCALATRPGSSHLDQGDCPNIDDILSACAGLVVVDEKRRIIRLVHYTTQTYLENTERMWFPDAQKHMMKICLTYMSFNTFACGFRWSDDEFEKRLQENPLYDYAAHYWGEHAHQVSTSCKEVIDFLVADTKVESAGQALMAVKRYTQSNYSQKAPRQIAGLHLAAYFGLVAAVEALLGKISLDLKDSSGWTPLFWAAWKDHRPVVELLLRHGASIESTDCNGQTPVFLAARNGGYRAFELLVNKGAQLAVSDWNGQIPLLLAATDGNEAVVELLLKRGADIESKLWKDHNQTPLLLATQNGHVELTKRLVKYGANIESSDTRYHWTSLFWAVASGMQPIVSFLLENGANVEHKDRDRRTPLWWAAGLGNEEIVRLLLAHGADLESEDLDGIRPLSWAVQNGRNAVVKLLIISGANLESRDNDGRTPLLFAALDGRELVAKSLIEAGASFNCTDKDLRTPILLAIERGNKSTATVFLKYGAYLESCDRNGYTPLVLAAAKGHTAVVEQLLMKGASTEFKDRSGRTAMSFAAFRGRTKVVEALLQHGANVESRDQEKRTPLALAAAKGHTAASKLLLGKGANIESRDMDGRTVLSLSALNGRKAIVELLLERGADIEAKDNTGQTPVLLAVLKGNDQIVKALIENGADLEAKNQLGRAPLLLAAAKGYLGLTEFLLKAGADASTKDNVRSWTPLMWARKKSHYEVMRLLELANEYSSSDLSRIQPTKRLRDKY